MSRVLIVAPNWIGDALRDRFDPRESADHFGPRDSADVIEPREVTG